MICVFHGELDAFRDGRVRDTGTSPGEVVFVEPFPTGYRGTTQPAGAFKEDGTLVVFLVGTRFVPP